MSGLDNNPFPHYICQTVVIPKHKSLKLIPMEIYLKRDKYANTATVGIQLLFKKNKNDTCDQKFMNDYSESIYSK